MYIKVQIPRNIKKTNGSQVFLHVVVAYTYLGPPNDSSLTVDHINRNCILIIVLKTYDGLPLRRKWRIDAFEDIR